jgi:hypothetical protein
MHPIPNKVRQSCTKIKRVSGVCQCLYLRHTKSVLWAVCSYDWLAGRVGPWIGKLLHTRAGVPDANALKNPGRDDFDHSKPEAGERLRPGGVS